MLTVLHIQGTNNKQKWVPLPIEPERRRKGGRSKEVAPPPRRQLSRDNEKGDRHKSEYDRRDRKDGV